ncbi:hypothetical protein D477_020903 [Arthrobacter crystallopoietes BAB-32]|uniref:Uncharacterized protein n=1 Tax=Arthrobacter crystallopoietes BAB-32 TaxID=1246476 RepID=N1UWW6_9MICC|nr:hypothetical protein [Arthrobacter crystallopoietes]EMY32297.1 hypothetical protein D477_020903 [Arthrobacter crystallopoietes BAB-32]
MSSDWTVVSLREPDQLTLIEAMVAAVPELHVRQAADDSLLELLDDAGELQLAIELPRLIRVPQEATRLLAGAQISAVPGTTVPAVFAPGSGDPAGQALWWQEIHVRDGVPQAAAHAESLCHEIARRCDGVVALPQGAGA